LTSPHSSQSQALQSRLRGARESCGLTQVDLAARLDRPQSFVSKYETGERRLDVLEFAQVCEAMGLDAADFLRDFLAAVDAVGSARGLERTRGRWRKL